MAEITYNDSDIHRSNTSSGKEQGEKFNEIKRVVNSKLDRAVRTHYLNNEVSFTPDPGRFDLISNLNLSNAFTLNAPINLPDGKQYEDGVAFVLRLRSTGVHNLTFNNIYRALFDELPTATTANKMIIMGFCYNAEDKIWDILSINIQL